MNAPAIARRVVLYARVSKLLRTERGDTKSVDQQLDELRRIARRDDVDVVAEFRDDGISASRYSNGKPREDWQATMAAILSGEVGELWVWEISRATRDRPVWAALIGACMAQDVKISVNGRVHDPNDPDDAFMLDLGAALAVKESAMTSKRICRDTAARAAQGLPHGRIPFGYRRVYDPQTRALLQQERDPETAAIVEELARRVLAGEALYKLAADMNARGVPSPEAARKRRGGDTEASQPWRPDQVRDVIATPAAAGMRSHRPQGATVATIVPATWEPIISAADHKMIVDKFRDPHRRTWVDATAKYLLTGLARCGECEGEIRRIKNRGTPSYACVGRRHAYVKGDKRFCVARKIEFVDRFVEDVVVERLGEPDLLDVFVIDGGDAQAAQRDLAGLCAELAELRAAKVDRRISLASFIEFEPDLLARIAAAERRAVPASVPPLIVDIAGEHAAERWEALELEQRREVIRLLCVVRILRRPESARGSRAFDPTTVRVDWLHPRGPRTFD